MNENSPAPKPPAKIEDDESSPKFRSPLFLWPAAIVLAVLFYFGFDYLADTFSHESTDDAFIAGHVISIAPDRKSVV